MYPSPTSHTAYRFCLPSLTSHDIHTTRTYSLQSITSSSVRCMLAFVLLKCTEVYPREAAAMHAAVLVDLMLVWGRLDWLWWARAEVGG